MYNIVNNILKQVKISVSKDLNKGKFTHTTKKKEQTHKKSKSKKFYTIKCVYQDKQVNKIRV